MFFKVHILDVSWGFPHIFPNISRFFKMPSIGGDEASKQDGLLEESRSSQLEGPAGNFFRSTKYQTNKKKQNIFGIANEKYLHFYWVGIYIYSSCFYSSTIFWGFRFPRPKSTWTHPTKNFGRSEWQEFEESSWRQSHCQYQVSNLHCPPWLRERDPAGGGFLCWQWWKGPEHVGRRLLNSLGIGGILVFGCCF